MRADTKITEFVFDTGEYYVGKTASGGAAVGMNSYCHLRVPAGDEMVSEVLALTPETVEAFIDSQIEAGRIRLG